jgi:hypothetical protein
MRAIEIINIIRTAIANEWPDAGELDEDSVFEREEGRIFVSLENGDAASVLFADGYNGPAFIDNQFRLSAIVAESIPGAFFEMETTGAMYLVY